MQLFLNRNILSEKRLDLYLMFVVWVSFNLQINKSTRKAKAKNCTFLYVCIWHLLTFFSKLLCTTIDRISISNLTEVIIIWIFSLLLIFELEFWNYIVRVTFLKFLYQEMMLQEINRRETWVSRHKMGFLQDTDCLHHHGQRK